MTKQPRFLMNCIVWIFITLLIAGSFPLDQWAAETQVSMSLSDNLAFIGNRIRVNIIVKTTADIDSLKLVTEGAPYEILVDGATQIRKQQDYLVVEKTIEIAFFQVGKFEVGPLKIELLKDKAVTETRQTNSVPVTIKSALQEDDKDIKPLKNPGEIKGNPFYILKYAIAALLIVTLITFLLIWLRRRKRHVPEETEPRLSPLEELQLGLKSLNARELLEKGQEKIYFLEFTEILKRFLHRVYTFNAEDFTTYETMRTMKRFEREQLLLNHFQFLFNTSDLVKFAKFIPDAGVIAEVKGKVDEMTALFQRRIAEAAAKEQEKVQTKGQNTDHQVGQEPRPEPGNEPAHQQESPQ